MDIGGGTVLLCEFENLVQLLSQIFCKYFPIRLVHWQVLILQAQKHGFHPAILAYSEALMASRRKKLVIVYGLLRGKREQIVLLYVPFIIKMSVSKYGDHMGRFLVFPEDGHLH